MILFERGGGLGGWLHGNPDFWDVLSAHDFWGGRGEGREGGNGSKGCEPGMRVGQHHVWPEIVRGLKFRWGWGRVDAASPESNHHCYPSRGRGGQRSGWDPRDNGMQQRAVESKEPIRFPFAEIPITAVFFLNLLVANERRRSARNRLKK